MKPVVAIVCDTAKSGPHVYHQVGDKYVQALVRVADVTPVLIPALDEPLAREEILALADGVLMTGGYSNIQRHHYGEAPAPATEHEDPARDKNTLPLVSAILEAGVPVLGICRGLQEMNVALGGTLYPRVHEIDGRFDHREDKDAPVEVQYGPAHAVTVMDGGLLETVTGDKEFMVNTVHAQAIRDVAPGLKVEALADDGTVEAVSVEDAKAFALAVQWHPEWKAWDNPQSTKIFQAFGNAVRENQRAKAQKNQEKDSAQ
ncbi:gamma-glutamyl-gamma-aminobutyrate hydrolase family protein [Kordiimonas marina]|uniref:gamma-glutamyl-gamma-aminobutyrate hydrolase family protein n=1 Tax=Kordiimonas marina TaxID=2872312 RepID=UPI001FF5FB07|nr:gamma-glutamyl-gamma-aminobutyrate hydrolase family protein [Kordiimonas marina]MCJ9430279.1 gamma-glutamyl-gamma-aminobutyrate hydrolase family protein [Kordiimonas marina]